MSPPVHSVAPLLVPFQLCPSFGGSFGTSLAHPAFLAPSLYICRIPRPVKPATNVRQCLSDTKVSPSRLLWSSSSVSLWSCLGETSCWMQWFAPGLGLHRWNKIPSFISRDSHCAHRVLRAVPEITLWGVGRRHIFVLWGGGVLLTMCPRGGGVRGKLSWGSRHIWSIVGRVN